MKALVVKALLHLGSELLIVILNKVVEELENRKDNSMDNVDAAEIKTVVSGVQVYKE